MVVQIVEVAQHVAVMIAQYFGVAAQHAAAGVAKFAVAAVLYSVVVEHSAVVVAGWHVGVMAQN